MPNERQGSLRVQGHTEPAAWTAFRAVHDTAVRHAAKGCAISVASTSLMSEHLSGMTVKEARSAAQAFIRMMRGEADAAGLEEWGDLASLQGVSRFPVRVKCATMAWHAFLESLPAD